MRTFILLTLIVTSLLCLNSVAVAQETGVGKFLGAKNSVYPDWFKESFLDFEEDIAEAAAQDKRLILYFHQAGCPYCNKLIEDNFADPKIGKKVRENFDLVAINMWGDREVVQVGGNLFTEKTLAAAMNVNFTPTLLFFDEKKKVVLRLNGYYPPAEFVTAVEYVAAKKEQQISYSSYVSSLKQGRKDGDLIHQDWLMQEPYDLSALPAKKPIAVLFEEPDCENCNLLHHKTFVGPVAEELLGQFNIVQLNRWADTSVTKPDGTNTTASQWAEELGLGYVPAILLFDSEGKQVIEITAMFKTFHVLGAFDYVASNGYLTEPSFQRYLSKRAEHIIGSGVDVDIWKY